MSAVECWIAWALIIAIIALTAGAWITLRRSR